MFFAVQSRIAGRAHLTDLNRHLIDAWTAVRDHQAELRPLLDWYSERDSKSFYYEVRATEPTEPVERAARFLYLNGTSWNHLWRENSKTGAMNAPWGDRAFKNFSDSELAALKKTLSNAELYGGDFREALGLVQEGDFVYLDPPYLPIFTNRGEKEPTSKFNKYNARVFDLSDLEELARICAGLSDQGVNWVMSNRDTEEIHDLFPFADIVSFTTKRSMAAQSKRAVESRLSPEAIVVGR